MTYLLLFTCEYPRCSYRSKQIAIAATVLSPSEVGLIQLTVLPLLPLLGSSQPPHPGELRPWESAPHPIPGKRARSPWSSVQREGEWGRGGEGSLWGAGARCCSRNSGAGKAAINQTRNDQSLRWVCNWGEKESADLGKERKMWVELARGESRMKHHASPCITAKLQQMLGKSQKWEENEKPEPWLCCVCDGWIRQVVKDGEEQPSQGCEA